jgi:hypothetical protein
VLLPLLLLLQLLTGASPSLNSSKSLSASTACPLTSTVVVKSDVTNMLLP